MWPRYGYDVKGFIDYVTNLTHTSVCSLSAYVTWRARRSSGKPYIHGLTLARGERSRATVTFAARPIAPEARPNKGLCRRNRINAADALLFIVIHCYPRGLIEPKPCKIGLCAHVPLLIACN
jgi:hypothetical protein